MPKSAPPVKFQCAACGIWLHSPDSQTPISGPCPTCGSWITAPAKDRKSIPRTGSRRKKGRIAADAAIDHTHVENRESLRTLKILALFALATACCLAVAWFLKNLLAN